MSNLKDFIGGSSAFEMSAEMADGVKTVPYTVSTDSYKYTNNYSKELYSINNSIITKLETVSPVGSLSNRTICQSGNIVYEHERTLNIFNKYDILTNTWTSLTAPSVTFAYGSMVAVGSDLIVLAYHDGANYINNAPLKYNTLTDTWTTLAAPTGTLPVASISNSVETGADRISVIGEESNILNTYTVSTNSYDAGITLNATYASPIVYDSVSNNIFTWKQSSRDLVSINATTGATKLIAVSASASAAYSLTGSSFMHNNIVYFSTNIDQYYTCYNLTTKKTQVANIATLNSPWSYVSNLAIYGGKAYSFMPYSMFADSGAVYSLDLTVPHFMNIKKG